MTPRRLLRPLRALAPVLLLLGACARPRGELWVEAGRHADGGTPLVLRAAPGVQVSAQNPPVLHLADGRRVSFTSPQLTGDSLYFAAPPTATLPGPPVRLRGRLRAAICRAGEALCRPVEVEL